MGAASSTHEKKRDTHSKCVRKFQGKKPLGRGRCEWDDYIKMDLNGRELDSVNLINLAKNGYQWRAAVKSGP